MLLNKLQKLQQTKLTIYETNTYAIHATMLQVDHCNYYAIT
jgi:hypothetical protein